MLYMLVLQLKYWLTDGSEIHSMSIPAVLQFKFIPGVKISQKGQSFLTFHILINFHEYANEIICINYLV